MEGVKFFLVGLVWPGPYVPQIYKCKIYSIEFSNSQAYGAHRSSHNKKKEVDLGLIVEGRSKRAKSVSMETPSSASKSDTENRKKGAKGKESNMQKNDTM